MSIFEKAAQKIAKAAAKADVPRNQQVRSRRRNSDSDDYVSDFSILKNSGFAEKLKEFCIYGSEEQLRRSADEYRRIKRPLLANAFGKSAGSVENAKLIAVASALKGEGKTYTSANLAISIARELNHTVLLVDTDSAKAGLSTLFGLEEEEGLVEVLADSSRKIEDVIVRIDELDISIIPAGRHHEDASELLSSKRMAQITEEITYRYQDRIVIFDAPPLLMTSEAQIIAGLVGQVVMVVAAVETPKNAVTEALSLLDKDKAVNLVLNKTNRSIGTSYYGGYYGYR
jgi:exopolysaccharide/PEP-CTERM locus tyrosine autokinase